MRRFERETVMEIERKFLPLRLPEDLAQYPAHHIEQGYLCVEPELRVRHSGDRFYLTYKSKGLMAVRRRRKPLRRRTGSAGT